MKFIVDEKILNSVLEYLGSRPYIESYKLIDMIRSVQKYEEPIEENANSEPTKEQPKEGE